MRRRSVTTLSTFTVSFIFFFILFSSALATVFEVGPEKKYHNISQVPFNHLNPGDTVKIYYRVEPYRETLVLMRSGTPELPIIITGVPENGKLPVIDGSNAVQTELQIPQHFGRSLITIGDETPGNYVAIKRLILKNANNSEKYYASESLKSYKDNAAGIFLWKGHHVTVSGCIISACGNGILTNAAPEVDHFTLNKCMIYNNGNRANPASSQEHNVYLQGEKTTVQCCLFKTPFSDGQNIKDRGSNTIIRYNWIEGGTSRQLDLVERKEYPKADAYVYGNVIIQGVDPLNHQIINWGGETGSRKGTLYFFNNTVIGKSSNALFMYVSQSNCKQELFNNAFMGTGRLWNGKGGFKAGGNWYSNTIRIPTGYYIGISGEKPLFVSIGGIPYIPNAISPLVNAGINSFRSKVGYMPTSYCRCIRRPRIDSIDIGAYEYGLFWNRLK